MVLGAATRRSAIRTARTTGLAAATVLLCSAAGTFGAGAAVAAPYPPTLPCSLSWSQDSVHGAGGAHDAVLVGNGYDTNQPLTVTLYPQARSLGATATNSTGSFSVPVDIADSAPSSWVTARSASRSCSVVPPSGGTGGSSSAPGTGGSSTGGGASGGNGSESGSGNSGSGNSGSGGSGSGGSGSGGSGGSGSGGSGSGGSGSGGSGATDGRSYPPASPTSARPGSSTPAGAAPTSSRSTTRAPAPNASSNKVTPLGLPLTAIVVIAALLLLGGALGVLILTRRAG